MNKHSDVITSYQAYKSRVAKETIPCYEPSIGKEELRLVADVIERNWLSENKYTREFEYRSIAHFFASGIS